MKEADDKVRLLFCTFSLRNSFLDNILFCPYCRMNVLKTSYTEVD